MIKTILALTLSFHLAGQSQAAENDSNKCLNNIRLIGACCEEVDGDLKVLVPLDDGTLQEYVMPGHDKEKVCKKVKILVDELGQVEFDFLSSLDGRFIDLLVDPIQNTIIVGLSVVIAILVKYIAGMHETMRAEAVARQVRYDSVAMQLLNEKGKSHDGKQ